MPEPPSPEWCGHPEGHTLWYPVGRKPLFICQMTTPQLIRAFDVIRALIDSVMEMDRARTPEYFAAGASIATELTERGVQVPND